MRLNSKRFFYRPTIIIQSFLNGLSINPSYLSPLSNRVACSVKNNPSTVSRVKGLFRRSSPSNIVRFVITVTIDSINRMLSRWRISNVFKKVNKRIFPSITYCNAPTTIVGIVSDRRISTTRNNIPPTSPLFSGLSLSSVAVFVGVTTFMDHMAMITHSINNRKEAYFG